MRPLIGACKICTGRLAIRGSRPQYIPPIILVFATNFPDARCLCIRISVDRITNRIFRNVEMAVQSDVMILQAP